MAMGDFRGRVAWVEQGPAESSASAEHVMADDSSKAGGGRPPSDRPAPKTGERPFDMWLQKQLHAMYDEITNEPLPDDLLNLIDKDAAREKQNGASDNPSAGKK
jgi:hypothetical protein